VRAGRRAAHAGGSPDAAQRRQQQQQPTLASPQHCAQLHATKLSLRAEMRLLSVCSSFGCGVAAVVAIAGGACCTLAAREQVASGEATKRTVPAEERARCGSTRGVERAGHVGRTAFRPRRSAGGSTGFDRAAHGALHDGWAAACCVASVRTHRFVAGSWTCA
jgi:hypothetical protein